MTPDNGGVYQTEQEAFWAGAFGDEYVKRNSDAEIVGQNLYLLSQVLKHAGKINTIIEFGANIGLNLTALRQLLPGAELSAIEINSTAVETLRSRGDVSVFHQSILSFDSSQTWDFVLIKGVLIHINPDRLPDVYDRLYKASGKYICVAEYYNPTPVALAYRGASDKLFKRDFAGEMLDRFAGLRLISYGFAYRRDPNFPQDDFTWFLLEKINV